MFHCSLSKESDDDDDPPYIPTLSDEEESTRVKNIPKEKTKCKKRKLSAPHKQSNKSLIRRMAEVLGLNDTFDFSLGAKLHEYIRQTSSAMTSSNFPKEATQFILKYLYFSTPENVRDELETLDEHWDLLFDAEKIQSYVTVLEGAGYSAAAIYNKLNYIKKSNKIRNSGQENHPTRIF